LSSFPPFAFGESAFGEASFGVGSLPYPLSLINVGTYPMDCTGDPLQVGLTKVNQNFAALFAVTGGAPAMINLGTTNQMNGDDAPVFCQKINSNFTALFAETFAPSFQLVINYTPPGQPIIGVADPGRVIFQKCNSNFAYLSTAL
jgi:hypothetical protein